MFSFTFLEKSSFQAMVNENSEDGESDRVEDGQEGRILETRRGGQGDRTLDLRTGGQMAHAYSKKASSCLFWV